MNENILVPIINILINFIDATTVYYICLMLIEQKPKVSIKIFSLGLLYSVILGIMVNYVDSYAYKITATIFALLIIKLLSKRKIHDVIIIYSIYFLCIAFIQTPLLLIIVNLELVLIISLLLVQILTLFIVAILCIKVPLYKLLDIIEKNLLLKLIVFNLASIILVSLFYINYEYTNSYLLYFLLFILIFCIGFYHTIKRVSFYTNEMPAQLHDVKNILITLQLSAHNRSNKELIMDLESAIEILGFDTSLDDIEVTGYNDSILAIINKKQKNSIYKPLIITDIKYYEHNSKLGFLATGYMLGLLLDNAIETNTKKPILIKIDISEDCLIISVANEYERQGPGDFDKMFQKRYSTKKKDGRGHGLTNLSKFVNKHDGELILEYVYNIKQASNYLIITIDIGDWKIYNSSWIKEILSL